MDSEVHLILLKTIVHKINLSVRFPCSLTFQLKVCKHSFIAQKIKVLTAVALMNSSKEHAHPNKHSEFKSK